MQTDLDKLDSYLPHVSDDARAKLRKYYEILLTFNAKINLVSKSTAPFAGQLHFADCVMGLDLIFAHTKLQGEVYDFGSGNGFPGLVLGILRPDLQMNLIESDLRKSEFMKHVAGEVGATNINVIARRYETLARGSVKQAVTRALGSLPTLLIQMNTLFADNGQLFHFKSDNWTTELANCPTQVFSHWDIQNVGQYTLPESTIDHFIVVSNRLKS